MRYALKSSMAGLAVACAFAAPLSRADVITDWNDKACAIVGKIGAGATGHRIMSIVQVSVYDAVTSIDGRNKPYLMRVAAPAGASVEAAVAAANRTVLNELVPGEKAATEAAYQSALASIGEGPAKADGIAVGERAAIAVLARAAADGSNVPETYQPRTTPGVYVPTMIPVFSTWTTRKPWIMASPDQFRPGPPPALSSDTWVRDYNEVKALGGKNSTQRTAQQTEIARFWEETRPLIYHPVMRSVAMRPQRTVAQNARLYAVGTVAMDDAMIAIFDAKYTYQFWRPITAIRNGGGNSATTQDLGWMPFIPTPMHPEYPCAHCTAAGAYGAVLLAEIGTGPAPRLSSTSPTLPGATRSWTSVAEFVQEVSEARIYDGVHYRNSTEVGSALGRKVGELAVAKLMN